MSRFIERLSQSHARRCATWAQDALDNTGDIATLFGDIRRDLPKNARNTELHRVALTQQAAKDAGYDQDL